MDGWFKEKIEYGWEDIQIDKTQVEDNLLSEKNPYVNLVQDLEDFEKIIIEIPEPKSLSVEE